MAYAATSAGSAAKWLDRIDKAIEREKTWREKAKKVIKRFRDERQRNATDSKINILWANTEVLKGTLFARMPKPDVRRRFPDAAKQNSASRTAAEVIERAITYVVDVERLEDSVSAAIDDVLLPGRGVCWWSYEPEIEGDDEGQDDQADTEGPAASGAEGNSGSSGSYGGSVSGGAADSSDEDQEQEYGVQSGEASKGPRVVSQTLCLDYVYWEDYAQGKARQDKDVPWKGRRHLMPEDEFKEKFPGIKSVPTPLYDLKDATGNAASSPSNLDDGSQGKYIEVWEIWDKAGGRRRIFVARGYPDKLQDDDDPYELSNFYPCPKPLLSITTTDKMEPVPEFLQYQDQALELDRISTRITRLIEQLKFRGVYDASVDGENVLANLPQADDGEFLPYRNWSGLKEKGGIENAVGFWPIATLVSALQELYVQRTTLIQAIYEITGISDIIRGTTDPGETKGAQVLKANFGSMRMQKRQREVSRFVRDLYVIGGEIIAEHFTQETLSDITAFDLPTKAEQLQLQAQVQAQSAPPNPMMPAMMPAGQPPPGGQQPPQLAGPRPQLALPPPSGNPAAAPPGASQGASDTQGIPTGNPSGFPFQAGPPIPRGGLPTLVTPAPPVDPEIYDRINGPSWDDVLEILRNDKLRSYRIDIETDTTAMEDATQVQQDREAFMAFFEKGLEAAYLAAVQAPVMLPLIKESFLYGIRTFKAGRSIEQAVEDAFDELAQKPPTPPQGDAKPDPAEVAKIEAQTKAAELNAKMQETIANHALKTKELVANASNTSAKIQADLAAKQTDAALEIKKLDAEMARTRADMGLRVAAHNKSMIDETMAAVGSAAPDQSGAPAADGSAMPQPDANPIVAILGQMQQMVSVMAAGQVSLGQDQKMLAIGISQLGAALAAPKRSVFIKDPITGKNIGAETVPITPQTVQ